MKGFFLRNMKESVFSWKGFFLEIIEKFTYLYQCLGFEVLFSNIYTKIFILINFVIKFLIMKFPTFISF